MSSANRSGSKRRKRRKSSESSRARRIREFVFGAEGPKKAQDQDADEGESSLDDSEQSEPPPPPPERPDSEPLYALATKLEPIYQQISHPRELVEHLLFQQGVTFLEHPGFTQADLLLYAQGENETIAQMALSVLSLADQDGDLRPPLLQLMSRVSIWRRYFLLEALLTHVPHGESLIGDVILENYELPPQAYQILLSFWDPFLVSRLECGENPTFDQRLGDLNQESINALDAFLDDVNNAALAPLKEELNQRRNTFVDLAILRRAGSVWGDTSNCSDGLVIEHPSLTKKADAIARGIVDDPRRSHLIVGEQGCGKTAVMRLIGQRLVQNQWTVFEANGHDLVAGQKYMGEFEERLKEVVTQLSGERKALWYVPDFTSLLQAGTHRWSRSGALDMLLPLVESGQIVMVGELRPTQLERLLTDKPRCQSAFDLCRVEPLNEEDTLDLARQWAQAQKEGDEPDLVDQDLLAEAWLLAGQYLNEQAAPGNLLDFLKMAHSQMAPGQSMTQDDLVAALSKATGLPTSILDDRHRLDTQDLGRFFAERIMGQPEAVNCVMERISIIKSGLADPSRPQGVFLFAGPTGTGKTELAKALATYLFGSEKRLFRLDMSEFQSPGDLTRLIGSADPEVEDRDSLCARVRKQPFAVVLLDEFEKAHPRVWDLFLQVFDDGRLSDAQGRTTDFRHAIIMLTSNLGAQVQTGRAVGFDKSGENFRAADVDKAIGQAFRPEFLNRLDRVVVFRPLSRETMRKILVKELKDIQQRRGLRNRDWEVIWEESATEFLLDRGFSLDLGARPLKRAVEKHLLTPLAQTIVQGQFPEGNQFLYIQGGGDRLQVEFIDPNEPEVRTKNVVEDTSPQAEGWVGSEIDIPSLAAIALAPKGGAQELQLLQDQLQVRKEYLQGEDWTQAKDLALSMMAVDGFWSSPDRFTILGEVEYRERIENGTRTAERLLGKMVGQAAGTSSMIGPSKKLLTEVAQHLWLLDKASEALAHQQPWEAFLSLDIRTDAAAPTADDRRWLDQLKQMYVGWARKRKMQIKPLQESISKQGDQQPAILAVSGFAARTILSLEQGLHIWEEPSSKRDRQTDHRQVLVRVASQPEEISGQPGADLLPAAKEILDEPMPGAPAIVRHYRQRPDPLVKDRLSGWRVGHLDRVLAGEFDLLSDLEQETKKTQEG